MLWKKRNGYNTLIRKGMMVWGKYQKFLSLKKGGMGLWQFGWTIFNPCLND